MAGIRILFAITLLVNFVIVGLAGLLTGLILDFQYLPGQSLGIIFDFKLADIVILNAICGGLIGMVCGVLSMLKLMRNPIFCSDSKDSSQLPAMAVVWMATSTIILSVVVFVGNWIADTPRIDYYMQDNRFFELLKYWLMIYLMSAVFAGVVNGGVIFVAHKYCVSRRKQNDDGTNQECEEN